MTRNDEPATGVPADCPAEFGMTGPDWIWRTEGTGESGDIVWRVAGPGGVVRFVKRSARGTGLLAAERDRLRWLHGRVPVPEPVGFRSVAGVDWLVTREVPGRVVCDPELANILDPRTIVSLYARGLRVVHAIPVAGCPFVDRLDERIRRAVAAARRRGDDAAADAFLARPVPAEVPVFTHGDYCEPNVLIDDGRISGYIDIGFAGVADRYSDFAQAYYSLGRNGHGELIDFFFSEYGLPDWDREKVLYFRALEDLFGG